MPGVGSVSLVVSWFGSDLRCERMPAPPCGRPRRQAPLRPLTWGVAGLTRATAPLVSTHEGRPAYGGTPSDQTVVAAIEDLKERGHAVTFNPFILMDVPHDNALDRSVRS